MVVRIAFVGKLVLARGIFAIEKPYEDAMPSKAELTQVVEELEEEYRYWTVEVITLDRGIENLEEKIDLHEQELGSERVEEFRSRLDRTRECHTAIEERLRYVRWRLHDLRTRLSAMA